MKYIFIILLLGSCATPQPVHDTVFFTDMFGVQHGSIGWTQERNHPWYDTTFVYDTSRVFATFVFRRTAYDSLVFGNGNGPIGQATITPTAELLITAKCHK